MRQLFHHPVIWLAAIAASAAASAQPAPTTSTPAPAPQPSSAVAQAAQPPSLPETKVGGIFGKVVRALEAQGNPLPSDLFAESFTKRIAVDQVNAQIQSLIDKTGGYTLISLDPASNPDALSGVLKPKAPKGTDAVSTTPLRLSLGLDKMGRVELFRMTPAPEAGTSAITGWAELDTALKALPGKTGFYAAQISLDPAKATVLGSAELRPMHELNSAEHLAIGSTCKLYVLGALSELTLAGKLAWTDKVAVQSGFKSLPGGKVFGEAAGTVHSVGDLAELMISISDNSATDHLIARAQRENIEKYMSALHDKPGLNKPFLTTREMSAIKLAGDPTLQGRWAQASEAIRRDMLLPDDQRKPTRPAGATHNPGEIAAIGLEGLSTESWTKPRAVDTVEWFASPAAVGRVLADLARLRSLEGQQTVADCLSKNPGLPIDRSKWSFVGFKGGSEPGVMNLSWLLTRSDGKVFVMSLGWNNTKSPVDDAALVNLASQAIRLLEKAE